MHLALMAQIVHAPLHLSAGRMLSPEDAAGVLQGVAGLGAEVGAVARRCVAMGREIRRRTVRRCPAADAAWAAPLHDAAERLRDLTARLLRVGEASLLARAGGAAAVRERSRRTAAAAGETSSAASLERLTTPSVVN